MYVKRGRVSPCVDVSNSILNTDIECMHRACFLFTLRSCVPFTSKTRARAWPRPHTNWCPHFRPHLPIQYYYRHTATATLKGNKPRQLIGAPSPSQKTIDLLPTCASTPILVWLHISRVLARRDLGKENEASAHSAWIGCRHLRTVY